MSPKTGKRNRNRGLLIVASLLLIGLLSYLVWQRKSSAPQRAFDKAVKALEAGDAEAAKGQLGLLRETPEYQIHADLIESGSMLNEQRYQHALSRLNAMEDRQDIRAIRSVYIAKALAGLYRLDEAETQIQKILDSDPKNSMALKSRQHISELREAERKFIADFKPTVDAFCGDCHITPRPDSFPKSDWEKEVLRGFDFYELFERHDLKVPDADSVYRYFVSQAPHELDIESILNQPQRPQVSPQLVLSEPQAPAVEKAGAAFVTWESLGENQEPVILVSNMQSGPVLTIDPNHPDRPAKTLAILDNPCHTAICDLNGDGNPDVLVADLGSFLPEDHDKGRVVCLKATGGGRFEQVVLLDKIGRVSDVEPGDFDSDGDLDLIVAEFGWLTTGRILYLENVGKSPSEMKFEMRVIDPRHGTIHVPTIDLNNDGHLDFIALIAQEYEAVVAFLNDGHGQFTAETLFTANDPSFGSSGIELVDMDQDNDVDILYTNGDSFDSYLLKPYHGIQWLENQGDLKFKHHHVLNCFGVYRAIAGDVDADGDLDIFAVMALPIRVLKPEFLAKSDSVICLINDGKQNFEKYVIASGNCYHTSCEAGDFDGDGDLDLAVSNFYIRSDGVKMPMVDIWRNQLINKNP